MGESSGRFDLKGRSNDGPNFQISILGGVKEGEYGNRRKYQPSNRAFLRQRSDSPKRRNMAGAKLFQKAKSEQAFFKVGLYGKTGTGKTFTSLLWAEGLAARENKRIAYIDTERGTEFYAMNIPERKIHPEAFDFDRLITRSLMDTVEAIESIDPAEYGVVVIDSITHLWEAAQAAYQGKKMSNGGIPIQAWQGIKRPYKKLISLFLDGNFHAIICGREGVVMENNEEGEPEVVGTKMKAEGETPHEPHILGRMRPGRDSEGGYIIKVFFEKDRSGILTGREIDWPNYKTIEPVVGHLNGTQQGKLGNLDDVGEHDAAKQEKENERAGADRQGLYNAIRTAILAANNPDALKLAWSLTAGKKGKLGEELFGQLTTIKDTRKEELMGVAV